MKGQGAAMPHPNDDEPSDGIRIKPANPVPDIFDLGGLAMADTAEMAVINPLTKMPTNWVWTFAGPGHPVAVSLNEKMGHKDRAEAFQLSRAMAGGREPKAKTNAEIAADNALRLGGRVLGWTPCVINGKELIFSVDKAVEILRDPQYGWLYTQVFNFLREEEVFLKPSQTS